MKKEKDFVEIDETLGERSVEGEKNTQKKKEDCLNPKWGVSYEKFVAEKDVPGTPSNLAHNLMEDFNDLDRKMATNLIKNALQPADLLTYILEEARNNKDTADAVQKEIIKRLRSKGIYRE
jgi:hypothetical protein